MARQGWTNQGWKAQEDLEFASDIIDEFPKGKDAWLGTHWITTAITSGCIESINWMIEKGVQLAVKADDGYPPVITCVESEVKNKPQILDILIASGANINEQGVQGWTPLHKAAIQDDVDIMLLLLNAGADATIRTGCDDDATAEEEARVLGHVKSADFIASYLSQ